MLTDLLDRIIIKTAHVVGACVFGVVRFYVYAQVVAVLLLVSGLVGLGLYFTLSTMFNRTFGS